MNQLNHKGRSSQDHLGKGAEEKDALIAAFKDPRVRAFKNAALRELAVCINRVAELENGGIHEQKRTNEEGIEAIHEKSGVTLSDAEYASFVSGTNLATILTHRLQSLHQRQRAGAHTDDGCGAPSQSALLVCDTKEAQTTLSVVTAQGIMCVTTIAVGFDAIVEITQASLGLKYRESAIRIIFNKQYDFTEKAKNLVAPIENAVLTALPSLSAAMATELAITGLLGGASWFWQELASVLGLKPMSDETSQWAKTAKFDLEPKTPQEALNDSPDTSIKSNRASNPEATSDQETWNCGNLYILANSSMPGLLKIGYTERDPGLRASEISSATAAAVPFILVYHCAVSSPAFAEQELHRRLAEYRINGNREFFRIEVRDAIAAVDAVAAMYPLNDNICLEDRYREKLTREEQMDAVQGADVETEDTLVALATDLALKQGSLWPSALCGLLKIDHAKAVQILQILQGRSVLDQEGNLTSGYATMLKREQMRKADEQRRQEKEAQKVRSEAEFKERCIEANYRIADFDDTGIRAQNLPAKAGIAAVFTASGVSLSDDEYKSFSSGTSLVAILNHRLSLYKSVTKAWPLYKSVTQTWPQPLTRTESSTLGNTRNGSSKDSGSKTAGYAILVVCVLIGTLGAVSKNPILVVIAVGLVLLTNRYIYPGR